MEGGRCRAENKARTLSELSRRVDFATGSNFGFSTNVIQWWAGGSSALKNRKIGRC